MARTGQISKSTASTSTKPRRSSGDPSTHGSSSKTAKNAGPAPAWPEVATSSSSSPSAPGFAESSPQDARTEPNESDITRFSYDELWTRPPGKTDWARVDALTDEDIARAVSEDPDAAPLDLDWSNAVVMYPKGKLPVSIRIDPDVVAFFKSQSPRYQTRMNAVLRSYMERELKPRSKKARPRNRTG